jgi:alpha-beta hydrolase superfamily lysophospholipase
MWAACAPRTPSTAEPIVTLPGPTGTHTVGRLSRLWGDFVVHVWYPMQSGVSGKPTPYVQNVELLQSKIDDSYFEILRSVGSHSFGEKTPSLDRSEQHPVVVFSHGNQMSGLLYTTITEDLASYGYVVVSIDHPGEALFTIFPDGKVVTYSLPQSNPGNSAEDPEVGFRRMIDRHIERVSLAVARLPTLFPGQLDLSHVAVVGHSVGGIAASRICETDDRVAACANLDGREHGAPFYLSADSPGPARPFLYFSKPLHPDDGDSTTPPTTLAQYNKDLAAVEALDKQRMSNLKTDSYRVILAGAKHDTFSDVPLLLPSSEDERVANLRRIRIVREYLRAFLDKYLRNRTSTLVDQTTPPYPEIEVDVSASRPSN